MPRTGEREKLRFLLLQSDFIDKIMANPNILQGQGQG